VAAPFYWKSLLEIAGGPMDNLAARAANRLAGETSPYLRQHAHNPVDWYPWGPPALEQARLLRRPILLSIGYAACHWCHVMAHESFEDPATAALMNQLYVNIKVDREERPDLDRIYQLAQQMLTGRRGGWPLTMFLMHDDQRPFFGGTYFPAQPRAGLPAFGDLLQQVATYYHQHLEELRPPAAQIAAALADLNATPTDQPLTDEPLRLARARFEQSFDARFGGFGGAPKFPHAPALSWLLRAWHGGAQDDSPDLQALYMASLTLTRMAEGGVCDQLGGGFYRYSVDERWEIPHFEKMLYDNAQLLRTYAEGAAATGEVVFADAARAAADFMSRELRSGQGALYSSLDADSEGHEGRFYVWTREQVDAALEPSEAQVYRARFGLDGEANFEHQWHLVVRTSREELVGRQLVAADELDAVLENARDKLLAVRRLRVRPGLDDKVLTSWNALAITGLAAAARHLDREDYGQAATAALQHLYRVHWRDGRLLASSAGGPARLAAYLDDYAFLLEAILELAAVRFRADELAWALELAEVMLRHFQDGRDGGFFFTADDHEALISRPKSFGDEAIPAGNAVAARSLLRLGYLLGETRYLDAAERTLRAAWPALAKYPDAHATMLVALEEALQPPQTVILRGPAPVIEPWRRQLNRLYAPRRWTLAIPSGADPLPAALADKPDCAAGAAYVCRGSTCSPPLHSLPALIEALSNERSR
jgi:uncharacterized protein YyaL (SSP411 family)